MPAVTILLSPYPLPVNDAPTLPIVAAWRVVPFSVPDKVNPVNEPRLVILVCAAVLNVPVSVAPLLPIVAALTATAATVPLLVKFVPLVVRPLAPAKLPLLLYCN